ncbi:unnamed protein product [Dicrocoelium dendriticum]|nr:unnamed protein product [Dicrocoelium dendriticum]
MMNQMSDIKQLLFGLFIVLSTSQELFVSSNYTRTIMLCPSGYWPASVDTMGGPYGTERTFTLPYMPDIEQPVCRFCPQVGCYVVRRSIKRKGESKMLKPTTTTASPTTTTASATSQISDELVLGTGAVGLTNHNTNVSNVSTEQQPEFKLYVSCDHWSNLPLPSDIVSYLDCVMIGSEMEFYLFIYEPRFQERRIPIVDCVDVDFLAWIPNGTELLGLELGFRMRAIPPFLFRYHQRIMQSTQYICIDGSSLTNGSIPFEDTERFASNKLTQVVFRSESLKRNRRPPKAPDGQYTTNFQSDEEIATCPHIVQHKPANLTPQVDCQFSPAGLPTTSDRVDRKQALLRCPNRIRIEPQKKEHRGMSHLGVAEELRVPPAVLSASLLVMVLLLSIGIIVAFCVMNAEKLMLCRTRSRKRREREALLASELADQAAKEAASAAAVAETVERQHNAWHPIYGRYGVIPPNMGGAFGAFASRTIDTSSNPPQMMNMTGAPVNLNRSAAGFYSQHLGSSAHG